MKTIDYSKIQLVFPERLRLFMLRFLRHAEKSFFGKYLDHLIHIDFIAPNYSDERDAFNAFVLDGTWSLTLTYHLWRAWRRDRFFHGSVWPCIVSGIVSLIVAYITARYLA